VKQKSHRVHCLRQAQSSPWSTGLFYFLRVFKMCKPKAPMAAPMIKIRTPSQPIRYPISGAWMAEVAGYAERG
jgi:hypothetical protein